MTDTTRRTVMFGAGGAGLAVVLSACSGYSTGGDSAAAPTAESPRPAGEPTDNGGNGDTGGNAASGIAKKADIPEGGGKVFDSEKVVITQPEAGTFKAFTAVCTHQGCTVASVSNGTINCPCHGSKFNIADGSVANGPATKPLAEMQIKVSGDSISLG